MERFYRILVRRDFKSTCGSLGYLWDRNITCATLRTFVRLPIYLRYFRIPLYLHNILDGNLKTTCESHKLLVQFFKCVWDFNITCGTLRHFWDVNITCGTLKFLWHFNTTCRLLDTCETSTIFVFLDLKYCQTCVILVRLQDICGNEKFLLTRKLQRDLGMTFMADKGFVRWILLLYMFVYVYCVFQS
jgi:hypothetical protein